MAVAVGHFPLMVSHNGAVALLVAVAVGHLPLIVSHNGASMLWHSLWQSQSDIYLLRCS